MADIGSDQRDGTNQIGTVGGEHTRHPIAEGVPDDKSRTAAVVLDHGGYVGGEVVQIDAGHGAAALSDAARLRT